MSEKEDLGPYLRTSLTPKHQQYLPRKHLEKEVRTAKASESRGKGLFMSTNRYGRECGMQVDLKQLFERKRDHPDRRKEESSDKPVSQKKSVLSTRGKYLEESTIKI